MTIYSNLNIQNLKGKNTIKINQNNNVSQIFSNLYENNEINNFIINSNLENYNNIK